MKAATYLLVFSFCVATAASSKAQVVTDMRNEISRNQSAQQLAFKQIKLLKEGVLLVRLQTRTTAIEALETGGNQEAAARIEQQQRDRNTRIAKAFESEWDFCPVYFFYAEQSAALPIRDFSSVTLMNTALEPLGAVEPQIGNFLTAEFAHTKVQDDVPVEVHFIDNEGEWNVEIYENPGGSNNTYGALRIMNTQLQQLHAPFPYAVRTFEDLPIRRKPAKVVRKMNRRLHSFYDHKQK